MNTTAFKRIHWERCGDYGHIADLDGIVCGICYSELDNSWHWDIDEYDVETAAIGDRLADGTAPTLAEAKRRVREAYRELVGRYW